LICGAEAMYFAAVPPPVPGACAGHTISNSRQVRRWSVTHACNTSAGLQLLTEAQAELGMRPAVLTTEGWMRSANAAERLAPRSLIHSWREVWRWRALLESENVGTFGEILHAHCFPAGMAGVRAGLPVVYDLAAQVGAASAGPWLTRSLRIAEAFVLTRAAAVVVHTQRMWDVALEQGVRAEDLFLIPDPVPLPGMKGHESAWPRDMQGEQAPVALFASSDSDLSQLLRAFAVVAGEIEEAQLLLEGAEKSFAKLASDLDIAERVHLVDPCDRDRSLARCAFVIAGTAGEGPNPLAIAALAHGRALLAADVAANREVSRHGRGCLWYTPGKERDLAFRAAFLARNPEFRAALGCNGHAHIQATRGADAVARLYDEVYRHALARHHGGRHRDLLQSMPTLALSC
jgi:glycosyltransferase involved in cell wall biosynthesis